MATGLDYANIKEDVSQKAGLGQLCLYLFVLCYTISSDVRLHN